jgi:lysozyme family protein
MTNKTFDKKSVITAVMIAEGGSKYTNDPSDRGGPTRYGITQAKANEPACKALWAKHNFNGDMQNLPEGLAFDIYDREFWSKIRMDDVLEMSTPLAYLLFSIGVNSGASVAGMHLQRALNVYNQQASLYPDLIVDGGVGQKTIDALYACLSKRGVDGLRAMLMTVFSLQMMKYIEIAEKNPSQEKYSLGWANRVIEAIREYGQDLI